jgi:SprT-like family
VSLKRWVCPTCGSGALAPARPRKDDVRRYCPTCSAKTGRLVERTCPSLEAARERKAASRTAARRRRQQREAAALTARHVVDGMDVRDELARLCRLSFVRRHFPVPRHSPIEMTVAWSKTKSQTTGHAKLYEWRIHLGLYAGCPRHEAQALLAHELAHAILPPRVGHGERWRRTFARIVADGYGLGDIPSIAMRGNIHELQATIEEALRVQAGSEHVSFREAAAKRGRP